MRDLQRPGAAAAALGIVVATLLALLPPVWPALAIAAGGVATVLVLLLGGRGRRRFAAAGAAYCLGFAVVAWLAWPLPSEYAGSPRVALATLGAASAIVVGVQIAAARLFRRLYRRLVRRGRRARIQTVRTIAKSLGLLRSAVGLLGRFTRIGLLVLAGVGIVVLAGLTGFVANALGVTRSIPWLGGEVDLALVLFVGALLVGFHALDAAQSTVIATREGVDAGRTAGTRVATTVRRYREESEHEE